MLRLMLRHMRPERSAGSNLHAPPQVTVSRIFWLDAPGDVSSLTEVDPDRVLVEAAHMATEGQQLAVGEAVRSLGALLTPLVELKKF